MHHASLPVSQETNSIRPERRIPEEIDGGRNLFASSQESGYAVVLSIISWLEMPTENIIFAQYYQDSLVDRSKD
ncbi:hypothetical protein J6590_061032 [Homalodisca vitripennis]|nr:hypothetical protein J6590_061032 [Homalodisca vitripennis]